MKILSRILPPKPCRQEAETQTWAHRRIEITLERESVSVLLPDRQQNAQATQQAALEARIPKTLKEKAK